MKIYFRFNRLQMALSGIRPIGFDHNGNDQFIVRPSDEFASKEECVAVIGKAIDRFIESIKDSKELCYYESKDLLIERLDRVKSSIERFWEYSTHSNTMDAYILQCFDVIFCLLRSTTWKGWYHSICLGTHKESWISFGNQEYDIFYSASIEDEYTVEHRFDQQMFDHKPKRAEKNTNGFVFPCGSRMYVPEEKPVKNKNTEHIPSKQDSSSTKHSIQTASANLCINPKPEEINIPKQDDQGNYIKLPTCQSSIQTQHGRKLILKTKV